VTFIWTNACKVDSFDESGEGEEKKRRIGDGLSCRIRRYHIHSSPSLFASINASHTGEDFNFNINYFSLNLNTSGHILPTIYSGITGEE